MSFTFEIKPPPSVNSAFRNVAGKGRVRTKQYDTWRNYAAAHLFGTVKTRVVGPFAVWINLPCSLRGDIDNRIKGIVDVLVFTRRVDDDKHMTEVHVCRANAGDLAHVTVKEGLKVTA